MKNEPLPPIPTSPSWDELRADPGFQAWHAQPYLRLMTAALRAGYPVSTAGDAYAMIRDAGIVAGSQMALSNVDNFCRVEEKERDKPKSVPYAGTQKED